MMDKPAPTNTQANTQAREATRDQKQPRFTDLQHAPRKPLEQLRTDDEARLAAEIEKLRG